MTTPRFFCWAALLSAPLAHFPAAALAGPVDQEFARPVRHTRSSQPNGSGWVVETHRIDVAVGVVGCEGDASYQPEMVYGNSNFENFRRAFCNLLQSLGSDFGDRVIVLCNARPAQQFKTLTRIKALGDATCHRSRGALQHVQRTTAMQNNPRTVPTYCSRLRCST